MNPRPKNRPPLLYLNRLNRLRALLREKAIAALLVTSRIDQIYLTGFTGEDGALLITPRSVILLTDGRFEAAARQEASWATAHLRKGPLNEALAKVAKRAKLTQVAFQPEFTSVAALTSFRRSARGVRFRPASKIVGQMRLHKDSPEINALQHAIGIAESAFRATCKTVRPGQTERQVAARLEFEMSKRGASQPSFPTIVAVGSNAALPHAHPGNRKIHRGSAILIDWGAYAGHYCSDLTRVVFLGKPPKRIARIYDIVLEAQLLAIKAIKPKMRMCDVDAVARGFIAEAGYGKQFAHGLGHGLGMEVHEPPRLSYLSNDKLAPGMVVTVEPGIYLPGVGGVRIEDDVLVTNAGARVLSRIRKDLAGAVL